MRQYDNDNANERLQEYDSTITIMRHKDYINTTVR